MSLATTVQLTAKAIKKGTVGLAQSTIEAILQANISLLDGIIAEKADVVYSESVTVADGSTHSLDLKGTLKQADGSVFTPAKLKLIVIASRKENTTALTLFGDDNGVPVLNDDVTTTVKGSITLGPGDLFLTTRRSLAGITVTATTGDIVLITNGSGAAAIVDILLVGASA